MAILPDDMQFTHNVSYAYLLRMLYVQPHRTKVISIIAHVRGEGLACVGGCSMCTRVCAQTLQHARQGRTLDYYGGPMEWT